MLGTGLFIWFKHKETQDALVAASEGYRANATQLQTKVNELEAQVKAQRKAKDEQDKLEAARVAKGNVTDAVDYLKHSFVHPDGPSPSGGPSPSLPPTGLAS